MRHVLPEADHLGKNGIVTRCPSSVVRNASRFVSMCFRKHIGDVDIFKRMSYVLKALVPIFPLPSMSL